MREKSPRPPSNSELEILEVLWRDGPSSVRHVWEALRQKTSYTSVLKTMQVMLGKELLERDASELSHIYRPKLARAQNQQRMIDDLVARAFGGSAGELVQRALASHPVSADELKVIQKALSQARKDRDSNPPA